VVQRAETVAVPRASGVRRYLGGLRRLIRACVQQLRWAWRFGSFGWRSSLASPDLLTHPRRVHIGRRVEIRKGARIEAVAGSDPAAEAIRIGDGTTIHFYCHLGAARKIEIGRNVLIAGFVYVTDHDHDLPEPGSPPGVSRALLVEPTQIDDDCWLGEGCKILKGVHLGRGCVVGANAVVTRSFPPYSVLVGVPARPVRAGAGEAGGTRAAERR
jgi:acetyltransferase-like isoleucine patch superfamily enzyme